MESLPADVVRLIEGRARPHRVFWKDGDFVNSTDNVVPGSAIEVVLDAADGLLVEFDLPQEAEANLQAIVAHQVPVQTPFTLDQITWSAGISQHQGSMITVQLVLSPVSVVEAVVQKAQQFDGPLVSIQLDGAHVPHQLLPDTHREKSEIDQEIRLGRRLIVANAVGVLALIAVVLFLQVDTVRDLRADAVQLRAEADVVSQLSRQLAKMEEENEFLHQALAGSGSVLPTLEGLAQVVHDGAWLDQVVITPDRIELGGYADTSALVLQAIDQSEQFESAVYSAPVRAQRGGDIERFSITADKKPELGP